MQRALRLARRASGSTSPNPPVGAIVVRDGAVVGRGFTQLPGSWHAEIVALRQAGNAAQGAILFTTLEPCCLYGRTPPCTQAIIEAGIAQVQMAMLDPNPQVAGRGRAELEAAGIRTSVGLREAETQELYEAYTKYITTGSPFVIAKFAMSLDGKIATHTGDSRWITDQRAREHAHRVRAQVDSIMVGINTVLTDDPQLTARPGGRPLARARQPLRVVVDSGGRLPLSARLFSSAGPVLLATTAALSSHRRRELEDRGVQVAELPSHHGLVDLVALLRYLGEREITSVLAEGGGALLGSLFDRGLVDRTLVFIAPLIIGGKDAVPAVGGKGVEAIAQALRLVRVRWRRLGPDLLVSGAVERQGEEAMAP